VLNLRIGLSIKSRALSFGGPLSILFNIRAGRLLSGLIIAITVVSSVFAAEGDETADQIRKEIKALEERVKQAEAGRLTAVEQLQDVERRIELRRRLIVELERKSSTSNERVIALGQQALKVEQEIQSLNLDLSKEESNLERLKRSVGERASFFYRKMAGARLAMLIGAKSGRDLARRRKYIAVIESFDRKAIEDVLEQRNKVADVKDQREILKEKLAKDQARRLGELEKYRMLIRDRRAEEEASLKERNQKQGLIKKIEDDAESLKAMLNDRRRALEEIEKEIQRLTGAPKRKDFPDWSPGTPFGSLAGKLIWPVPSETISQPFGPSRHPKLGTVTVNPGIDIRATAGDPVRSTAGGK